MTNSNINYFKTIYKKCNLCPRNCNANRFENKNNFCKIDEKFHIASITTHTGEEPVLSGEKGVCNIFFMHCNLQCIYCQNYQISRNHSSDNNNILSLKQIIDKITGILDTGVTHVGFVSPSHQILQMVEIINELHRLKYFPVIIYNSNGYDKVSTLKFIEPLIDVYLPDFKYSDDTLAEKYSNAPQYNEIATNALSEMIRQKGTRLLVNQNGLATKGVIVRHLILPNHLENSLGVLKHIRENFGQDITLSVMSQYFPPTPVKKHKALGRQLTQEEHQLILSKIDELGFNNGFIQELESANHYLPDFSKSNPFE